VTGARVQQTATDRIGEQTAQRRGAPIVGDLSDLAQTRGVARQVNVVAPYLLTALREE
jgi:hypothetical protein